MSKSSIIVYNLGFIHPFFFRYINNYEEEVFDSDISFEFHRESHHMHSIPRPAISEVSKGHLYENTASFLHS